jgi:hypothetical protein
VAIAPLSASLTLVNEPHVEQYVLWTSRPLPGAQASDLTHMRRMSGQTAGQSLLRSMVETLFAGLATTPASAEFLAPALTWLLVQSLSEPSVERRRFERSSDEAVARKDHALRRRQPCTTPKFRRSGSHWPLAAASARSIAPLTAAVETKA